MLSSLKKIDADKDDVFTVLKVNDKEFYGWWHHHPELEIMLIEKGTGTRYLGDSITSFTEGDITIIGSNLPHLFKNEPIYPKSKVKALVLYFNNKFTNSDFIKFNAFSQIMELLHLSQRGLIITGESRKKTACLLKKIVRKEGLDRLLELIHLLGFIARSGNIKVLSSVGFKPKINNNDYERINKIFKYVYDNFNKEICLTEVADNSNMSVSTFCRYFKKRTNKTFISFLNELRIGHACKMLIANKDIAVSDVCYESGYNNLTNFYIQFKKLKNLAPLDYQNKYKNQILK